MKTTFLLALLFPALAFGQGALTPPGAPAPTQKSLQEIWDKLGKLEARSQPFQTQFTAVSGLQAVSPAGLALAWNVSTVDSVGSVGQYTSLAFGPDGQPAISYYDTTNGDLKFARYQGSTWTASTVDSVGNVGEYTSLAFGPDGQPAISYHYNNFADLKPARKGLFAPAP